MKSKSLSIQLAEAKKDVEHYQNRADEIYRASEKLNNRIKELESQEFSSRMAVEMWRKDLLEIIRWHANPETAKFPYRVTKDQRNGTGEYEQKY